MKLIEALQELMQTAPSAQLPLLKALEQRLVDQRQWRDAWVNAEKRIEQLTRETDVLLLRLEQRKEKD